MRYAYRAALELLPNVGARVGVSLSAYCVYRAANAETVGRFVADLPAGTAVHLHALDSSIGGLRHMTRSQGPGYRMPLLQQVIDSHPPRVGDAILIFDDDVLFRANGGTRFAGFAAAAALDLAQPAHAFGSARTFALNGVRPLSTARLTRLVEVGPVVYIGPRAVDRVLPFPAEARMGWGVDILWSALVDEGFRLGVVDATPVMHFGPVASAYETSYEYEFMQRALADVGASSVTDVARALGPTWRSWQRRPPWTY